MSHEPPDVLQAVVARFRRQHEACELTLDLEAAHLERVLAEGLCPHRPDLSLGKSCASTRPRTWRCCGPAGRWTTAGGRRAKSGTGRGWRLT
jgi:hypothetical protein